MVPYRSKVSNKFWLVEESECTGLWIVLSFHSHFIFLWRSRYFLIRRSTPHSSFYIMVSEVKKQTTTQKKITSNHINISYFIKIVRTWYQSSAGLTDWPSEALFVSVDYSPHTSALCSQEPIRPSCKRKRNEKELRKQLLWNQWNYSKRLLTFCSTRCNE